MSIVMKEGGAGREDAWACPAKTLRLKTCKNFAELLSAFSHHTPTAQLRHEPILQSRETRDRYTATRKTRPSTQLPESAATIPQLTADPTFHSPQPPLQSNQVSPPPTLPLHTLPTPHLAMMNTIQITSFKTDRRRFHGLY